MKKLINLLILIVILCVLAAIAVVIWDAQSRDVDSQDAVKALNEIGQNNDELVKLDKHLFNYTEVLKSNYKKSRAYADSVAYLSNRIASLHQQNAIINTQLKEAARVVIDNKVKIHTIDAVKGVLHILISVPFLILLIILGLLTETLSARMLKGIMGNFRSVEAFGAKVELDEKAKANLEDTIKEYQEAVKFKYDIWEQRHKIRDKVGKIAKKLKEENFFKDANGNQAKDLRVTLHVPDLLFRNRLYQLTDYWPGGAGRGRTLSTRFGIMGLAWRSEEDQLNGNIPTNAEALIKSWSMTREEAESRAKQSLGAIMLRSTQNEVLGIFYIDSDVQDIFGDAAAQARLTSRVNFHAVDLGLITALLEINKELMSDSLLLDF